MSYFINYDINDFKYSFSPFSIQIGENFFSKEKVCININDCTQDVAIHGELIYSNNKNIKTNILSPNIMGPFSYIPFMECNHAILSMQNSIKGMITINNKKMIFEDGIGYIEKDWGISFPKSYIWCQGNNFKNSSSSFMLSIADIPFKFFNFRGMICDLLVDNKEYKFTTYNNAKILQYNVDIENINITLKGGKYTLNIKSNNNAGKKLIAPVKGNMNKDILESITSNIYINLKKDGNIIFSDMSSNCGLEIV